MEQWLAANWYWLLSITGLFFIAYWRLEKLEKDLTKHLDGGNAAPHPACPVHNQKFAELIQSLTQIENKLTILDGRIYDFMRSNGYHDRVEK